MDKAQHRWRRRLFRLAVCLLALTAALVAVGKYILVPSMVRQQIADLSAKYVDGKLLVGEVSIDNSGTITLQDVRLSDTAGRCWLTVQEVQLGYRNVLSSKRSLTRIDLSGLNLLAHYGRGQRFPIKTTALASPKSQPASQSTQPTNDEGSSGGSFDLRRLTIEDAMVSLVGESGGRQEWAGLSASMSRAGRSYEVNIRRQSGLEQFAISGNVNFSDWSSQLNIVFECLLADERIGPVLAALGQPDMSAAGLVEGNVTVTGQLDDPRNLLARGFVSLRNGRLTSDGEDVFSNAAGMAIVNNDRLELQEVSVAFEQAKIKTSLEEAQLTRAGRIRIEGLAVDDDTGRPVVHVRKARASIPDWAGPLPQNINAEGLEVWLRNNGNPTTQTTMPASSVAATQSTRPANTGANRSSMAQRLNEQLQDLADHLPTADISDASLILQDERGKEHRWGGINLQGRIEDSLYKVKLTRQIDRYYDWQTLTGEINPQDLQSQWRLEVAHNFTNGELSSIRKRLNVPLIQSGEGPATIDVSVEGPLDDTAKWSASGEVDLKSWTLRCDSGVNFENMFLLVRFVPGRADVKLVEAKVFEGSVKGNLYVLTDAGTDVIYGGTMAVSDASMDKLVAALAPNSDVDKGRLNASASFSCAGSKLENLRLRCAAVVENADLLDVPVLPALLSVLGVPGAQGLNQSDLAAVFKMDGAIITVEQASMANALVAIQAQPGGTIDVANKSVDMFVVGAPLNQLTNALEQVPIINLFVDISKSVINKLTRLRVSGQWDEPSSKLVHVEPLGNAAAGTVQFFRSVLKAGGDLGRDVLKPFNDTKDSMQPKE